MTGPFPKSSRTAAVRGARVWPLFAKSRFRGIPHIRNKCSLPVDRPRCFDPEIDHRIVDEAQAAAFLGELRDLIDSLELALRAL